MEIILSNHCKSLTGSFGRGFGYHIQRRKNGFFAKRNSKGVILPDGHWRFIATCACLAQNGLHIVDIRISAEELRQALNEANRFFGDELVIAEPSLIYNASDVLRFKERWLL